MKKHKFIIYILAVMFIISLGACSENDEFDPAPDASELGWQATTNLKVMAVPGFEKFIWETDLLLHDQYWVNDELKLNITLNTNEVIENFTKIDIYVVASEKDGYNSSAPFDKNGKLFATISSIPESGVFETVTIEAEDLYELFRTDFSQDRTTVHLLDGDVYEFFWVIHHKDGTTYDSRALAPHPANSWGVTVLYQDYAPPIWNGTFNYVILEVGTDISDWYDLAPGDIGSMSCTLIQPPGTYSVDDFSFLGSGTGTLTHDFLSGLVEAEGYYGEAWEISNVDGASLDIKWTDPVMMDAGYDYQGKARITRTDGNNWPSNIHTVEALKKAMVFTKEQQQQRLEKLNQLLNK